MGWLDHSTNNIILDAVLTDYGRRQLSSAGGAGGASFVIKKFALADDEVDYRMIQRYGRAIGKEKIEKNTPIFEAVTNQSVALKYPLAGIIGNGTTTGRSYMPYLTYSSSKTLTIPGDAQGNSGVLIDLTPESYFPNPVVNFNLLINNGTATGGSQVTAGTMPEMIETSYVVKVPDRFLSVSQNANVLPLGNGSGGMDPNDPNRIIQYSLDLTTDSASSFSLVFSAKSVDSTTKTIYGKKTGDTYYMYNYVTLVGKNLGTTLTVPVVIKTKI